MATVKENKKKKTTKTAEKTKKVTVPDKPEKKEETLYVSELDQYLFGQGTHYDIYKKMGAHLTVKDGKSGVYFAVWAPNAQAVYLTGDFNEWSETSHPMKRLEPLGIYELFVPEIGKGAVYKYLVVTKRGEKKYKSDPFGNYCEMRPSNASVVTDISQFRWSDSAWLKKRETTDLNKSPMAIYEVHPGSWKKHEAAEGAPEGFYNYRELAHSLADYVKDMGYTHVELMGIAEHPFDGSWGYQVTGYYAPTSRYGTPEDFMYFINYMHKKKIGVILDWVPAHFPRDGHGLAEFDGSCLYEYADPRKGEHPDWGTKVFDFGKNEVKNFLIANALFWMEQFHVDGLRVDAVASILYLDYGRQAGQWVPNIYGGNKNLEAIEFFKHLNSVVLGRNKGTVMIAEESTAWPKVTGKPEEDGLGFSMKWNMGWMNDFIEYMKLDPYFRQYNHNKMTFAMTYTYSEKYVLVLSHDEVVHLKCSMINKMPGFYDDKFANLKAGYSFMLGHPGKKLLFMGQEFAQLQEWSEARELDWYLLGEEKHRQMQNYVKKLLHLYQKEKALYECDNEPCGFEWINADDNSRSIFSFVRHSADKKNNLLFVINFTPVARPDYRVGVPRRKQYKLILNSDDIEFGGSGKIQPEVYKAVTQECDRRKYSFAYDLPAYGVAVFKF
ncbi:MAG: 1,4-alpha-glucan branching protein GlgB [Lachnospiraceae bacterium]|nr:1,4-alpha-glucan branching protein GlgB [Robinsoniella sp.]MDY3766319.1 1,4-alpha-glucan branching protein GlgB [Lachnospiraceae bacterium]